MENTSDIGSVENIYDFDDSLYDSYEKKYICQSRNENDFLCWEIVANELGIGRTM